MRVVGVVPSTTAVTIVAVDSDGAQLTVGFKVEWKMAGASRAAWYAEVRTRFTEYMRSSPPACVSIAPVESMNLRYAQASWFETAELRGVIAEAAHSAGIAVEMRSKADITRALNPPRQKGGPRAVPAADFEKDEAFWERVVAADLEKKYRQAALLAFSRCLEKQ